MLEETLATINELAGHEYLYFDSAIIIRKSPIEISIWGVCVSNDERLMVMDSLQEWYPVHESRDRLILELVNRKVKQVAKQYKPINS